MLSVSLLPKRWDWIPKYTMIKPLVEHLSCWSPTQSKSWMTAKTLWRKVLNLKYQPNIVTLFLLQISLYIVWDNLLATNAMFGLLKLRQCSAPTIALKDWTSSREHCTFEISQLDCKVIGELHHFSSLILYLMRTSLMYFVWVTRIPLLDRVISKAMNYFKVLKSIISKQTCNYGINLIM